MTIALEFGWKCDFCSDTIYEKIEDVELHQKNCIWNPKFKLCWSCEFHSTGYRRTYCNKDVIKWDFIPKNNPGDYGNCSVWHLNEFWYDKKIIRKLKMQKINNYDID